MFFDHDTIPLGKEGHTGHRQSAEDHTWYKLGTGMFFELSFTLEEEMFFNVLKAELII